MIISDHIDEIVKGITNMARREMEPMRTKVSDFSMDLTSQERNDLVEYLWEQPTYKEWVAACIEARIAQASVTGGGNRELMRAALQREEDADRAVYGVVKVWYGRLLNSEK